MDAGSRDPRTGQGIGRRLETAREARGLSIAEVEERTRIRSRYLRDLEQENFDVLPAVYVLGSIKTYADFLGLDGAALSRELKERLAEPSGPDQLAALEDPEGEDRRPGILPAAGFDQLFLGAGVLLVSIFAIMTLVAAVAQDDQTPVSEVSAPSTPDIPSEIALAANAQDDPDPRPANGERDEEPDRNEQGPSRESGGDAEDRSGEEDRQDKRPDPKPAAVNTAPANTASASPGAGRPSEVSAGSASPAPEVEEDTSGRGSSPEPSAPASAASAPSRAPSPESAPSGSRSGGRPRPAFQSEADRVSAGVDRAVNEAFTNAGIDR